MRKIAFSVLIFISLGHLSSCMNNRPLNIYKEIRSAQQEAEVDIGIRFFDSGYQNCAQNHVAFSNRNGDTWFLPDYNCNIYARKSSVFDLLFSRIVSLNKANKKPTVNR